MGNDGRGLLWPLAALFLLSVCGTFVALFAPALLDPTVIGDKAPDHIIAIWFLVVAALSGILLYFPRFWLAITVPNLEDISKKVDVIQTTLTGPQGILNKVDGIATKLNAMGDVRATLDAIQAKTDKIV